MPRPFFRHLPGWIHASAEYQKLRAAELWTLHMIAAACDHVVDDVGSTVGCLCGGPLYAAARCPERTFRRTLANLRQMGFVVKVGQGGGSGHGNALGIPGELGALDRLDVGDDDRFRRPKKTRPRRQGTPGHSGREYPAKAARKPGQIGCAPSRSPSSSSSKINKNTNTSDPITPATATPDGEQREGRDAMEAIQDPGRVPHAELLEIVERRADSRAQ